jgi:hypothetical protein
MHRLRRAALAAALALAAATPARADGFLTPFYGFNFGGDQGSGCPSLTNCEVHRSDWGVSVGAMNVVGFEEDLGYSKNFFGDSPSADNAVLTLMSNLLIGVPAGPVQPYALVGVGLIRPHFKLDTSNLVDFESNSFGWDIGGGVNLYFSRSVGVRGDLRKFQTFQDLDFGFFTNQKLSFWRASVGLALRF